MEQYGVLQEDIDVTSYLKVFPGIAVKCIFLEFYVGEGTESTFPVLAKRGLTCITEYSI